MQQTDYCIRIQLQLKQNIIYTIIAATTTTQVKVAIAVVYFFLQFFNELQIVNVVMKILSTLC